MMILLLIIFNLFYPGINAVEPADLVVHKKMHNLPLKDLSAFKTTGSNWQIVGSVKSDNSQDKILIVTPGTGVLVNLQDEQNRAHLFTNFEHGDIELELEVMIAKESNSGIYLQGRYEVQIYDSWGKEGSRYSYMGGIYQRTDPTTNKGYEGSAPLVNASQPAGEWQKLKIVFKAPRFDENGDKVKNALFKKVFLNGVLIQKDFEVSGPTRSAAYEDESPFGPIMIQGNHGPVAFRNIKYTIKGGS